MVAWSADGRTAELDDNYVPPNGSRWTGVYELKPVAGATARRLCRWSPKA